VSVLLLSFLILLLALLAWPFAALLRRADRATSGVSPDVRRLQRFQRIAVVVALAYITAWFLLILPILDVQVAVYHSGIDWLVGLLEASGLLAIGAALAGVWVAWRLRRTDATRLTRIWAVLVALALLGVVWLGLVGHLITWNLNY